MADPQHVGRFRVDTDQGSFEVEVEMPSTPEPSGAGMARNAVSSAIDLGTGAIKGLGLMALDPVEGLKKMGQGLVQRSKEYVDDIHPIQAGADLHTGHPLRALSNLLPVEMMYRDPVGVGADALGVEGLVKGVNFARSVPDRLKTRSSRQFNAKPLAEQMKDLPESGVGGVRSPTPPRPEAPPTPLRPANLQDLPLHEQQRILETTTPNRPGDTGARGGDAPPLRGATPQRPANLQDLPLWKQQEILEASGDARVMGDTGVRGGDFPPSRPVASHAQTPPQPPPAPTRLPRAFTPGGASLDLSALPQQAMDAILAQLKGEPAPVAPSAAPSVPGVSAHTPTPASSAGTLDEMRRLGGSREAAGDARFQELAKEFNLPATSDTVRDLTGGRPGQVPLNQSTGTGAQNLRGGESLLPGTRRGFSIEGLDEGYRRRLADERGFINPEILKDLPLLLEALTAGYLLRGKMPIGMARQMPRIAAAAAPALVGGAGVARLPTLAPQPSH